MHIPYSFTQQVNYLGIKHFQVEVKEISQVHVTLDFTEGFNIQVENSNDMRASASIKPMSSDTVAVVRAYEDKWANPCKIM